jgi:hypothetical protein
MKSILLILLNCPNNKVESLFNGGDIPVKRIRQIWRAYNVVWNWLGFRTAGEFGTKHEVYLRKHGKVKYFNKINKVRLAFNLPKLFY